MALLPPTNLRTREYQIYPWGKGRVSRAQQMRGNKVLEAGYWLEE